MQLGRQLKVETAEVGNTGIQKTETRRNFKYKFNSHILCVTEMQRRQAAYAGKAQNKQHKLFRQSTGPKEREKERGTARVRASSKFSCSEHISSESTVAWRHRTQHAADRTDPTDPTVEAGNVLAN